MTLLLTTKFSIPPPRPVLVTRPRLVAQLNAGIKGKVTLLSAPAGFGKTTLAVQWLHTVKRAVAWLSLEGADNDPARFLAYLLAALGQVDGHLGRETRELLRAPQPPSQDVIVATLLNEIAAQQGEFILAIDDYHLIQTPSIHQLLFFIVEHQPAQMHLTLLTREDPPLPLARLRARSQVNEIRQADLRFTPQESADFLGEVMGLDISPELVAALERRTEGWIAGLQLAALSMKGRDDLSAFVQGFTGSNRYILDYLVEEVIEQQPQEMRDFLLKTSILERLNASLCDAVAGRNNSQELLKKLERQNLFIVALDQSRANYRYHRLFAELLRHRLRQLGEPSESSLHRRASQWLESEGALQEAIVHTLAATDWGRASELIQQISDSALKRGEVVTMLRWFSQIPDEALTADPALCLEYSWPLLLSGQFEAAARYLDHAGRNIQGDPALLAELLVAQAYLARAEEDYERLVETSQSALALLPEDDWSTRCIVTTNLGLAYWHSGFMAEAEGALAEALTTARKTGNRYAAVTAQIFQARVLAVRGRLRDAAAMLRQVIQTVEPIPSLALAYLDLGALHYEWNDLEESARNLDQAVQISRRYLNHEFLAPSLMMAARLRLACGDSAGALEMLQEARHLIDTGNVPASFANRLAAAQIQVALAQDDLEEAESWAGQLVEDADCHSFHRYINLTQARWLLAQDKPAAASAHLAGCYDQAEQAGWGYGAIAARVLQSLSASDPEEASELLADALRKAQPEGYQRTFADAGPALAPLLHEAARNGIEPAYVGQILAVLNRSTAKTPVDQSALIEPLSERELEVLRLVAAGLSNRQIAEELTISPGTAKTHVHNICGKLGAANRTEAAVLAKDLALV